MSETDQKTMKGLNRDDYDDEEEENITEALKRSKMTITYEKQRDWCGLIPDILHSIMQKLDYIDIIRCQSVCKVWSSIAVHEKPNRTSPWKVTLCFNPNTAALETLSLYNLYERKEYPSSHQIYNFRSFRGSNSFEVFASKHGWLYLHVTGYAYDDLYGRYDELFCYNPFTRKKKKLPSLNNDLRISKGTFTADPTSSDCMFFLVVSKETPFDHRLAMIYIYKNGDATWHYLISLDLYPWEIHDVVYCNGFFYCVIENGLLGAFDIVNGNLEMLEIKRPKEIDTYNPEAYIICYKLVNINEELVAVASYHMRYTIIILRDLFRLDHHSNIFQDVFRLDHHSNMRWCRLECLDNYGLKYPFSYPISTAEENKQLAGQIYNPSAARRSLIDILAELNRNRNKNFCYQIYSYKSFEFWIEEAC